MPWEDRKGRNWDKIQYEGLRKRVDLVFCELHDIIEEAYYKHWKLGESKVVFGLDVRPTPEESKLQFDIVHANLWNMHEIALEMYNNEQATIEERVDPKQLAAEVDRETGAIIKTKVQQAREALAARPRVNMNLIKNFIQTQLPLQLDK